MKSSKNYLNKIKKFLVGEVQSKKLQINEKRFTYYVGFSAHVPSTRYHRYSAKNIETNEPTYVTTDQELEEGTKLIGSVRKGGILFILVSNYLSDFRNLETEENKNFKSEKM